MTQSSFDALRHFITRRMRMSHIYQPLMLKTMLERGGSASIRQIATAFLNEDESQVEYYEQIVKNMPGRVLAKHQIVERTGDRFRLDASLATLTKPQRAKLATLCQEAIAKFKAARGAAIWEHRRPGPGIIPGRQRYETLKAAGFRCELCGVSADERALDVDHIRPRKHGGTADSANLQALCWKCNGDKGAGDDADLRQVRAGYAARQAGCPFCDLRAIRVVADNALAVLIRDAFPVTPGHLLAIPRRHVGTWFDLHRPEQHAVKRGALPPRAVQVLLTQCGTLGVRVLSATDRPSATDARTSKAPVRRCLCRALTPITREHSIGRACGGRRSRMKTEARVQNAVGSCGVGKARSCGRSCVVLPGGEDVPVLRPTEGS